MVPQTLPAAQPSFLARVIHGKTTGANGGVLRDQIPPGAGTKSPPRPILPKMALETVTEIYPKALFFIVVSCFLGFFFREAPKTPKSHLADSATIRRRFGGGDFCTKSPFWFFSDFFLAPLAHSQLRTVLKPLFL